jgi:hypothetical protein
MLTGTADVEALARRSGAPTIVRWASDDVVLGEVASLQLIVELRRHQREDLLPPGLHPTDPPSMHIQFWRVSDSPWGPFTWAHTRLSCRSGVRARALTTASVIDSAEAAGALAERFGFPITVGEVDLAVHYDSASAEVRVHGHTTLAVIAVDPTPMALDAVQATSTMNLAHTPDGLRLVQVEARHRSTSVERLHGEVHHFDAESWGDDRLDPYDVVSAVVVRDESVTLPHVRFVCRPDVSAFEGTERIDAG